MPSAAVIGRATEPVLPRVSKVVKSAAGSSPRVSSMSLRWARPTWWQKVLSSWPACQPRASRNSAKVSRAAATPSLQEGLRIGPHQEGWGLGAGAGPGARPQGRRCPPPAKLEVVGPAADRPAQQPISPAAQIAVDQHQRGAAGADGQGGEGGLDVLRESVRSALSSAMVASTSPRLLSVPTTTPRESVPIRSCWPPGGAVEESQAGVGHVVDGTLLRQAEAMMDAAGRGRLEEVAADRAVDQGADLPPVDAGGLRPSRRFPRFWCWAACPGAKNAAGKCPTSTPAALPAAANVGTRAPAGP